MSREIQSPGSVLAQKFMDMDTNASKLARLTDMSIDTVHRIMCGVQPITDEIASKLAAVLGTTHQFWMDLQTSWDISNSDDRCEWCKHMSKIVRQTNDQIVLHANININLKNRTYELEAENARLRAEIEQLKGGNNS